ncbi:hypothetical protein N657DRAFT_370363 [Parathielavia appendiculata]|uniref:Uncharacterized protein n=1 Tax=Parathielavia appendiculata TaxID=2587402 RepID=A0AAN6YY89_9PEZI|nr:hypothetical protein N657DRAFT_370363 [Parathielavia appendiculata]
MTHRANHETGDLFLKSSLSEPAEISEHARRPRGRSLRREPASAGADPAGRSGSVPHVAFHAATDPALTHVRAAELLPFTILRFPIRATRTCLQYHSVSATCRGRWYQPLAWHRGMLRALMLNPWPETRCSIIEPSVPHSCFSTLANPAETRLRWSTSAYLQTLSEHAWQVHVLYETPGITHQSLGCYQAGLRMATLGWSIHARLELYFLAEIVQRCPACSC